MFGRLTLDAFKHDTIEYGADASMILTGLIVVGLLFYFKSWKRLWSDWITTVDHKKIGIMYILVAFVMLFKGVIDGVMMRAQQAMAAGDCTGYLTSDHFQQIFSAHGVTMIFFVGMGAVFAMMNLVVPLQIGARDVAFPFLNAVSFWLFAAGASYIMISLIIGEFSAAGWLAYPPLSGIDYSPGVGVDYWIWTLQISGVGSLLSGVNFIVTILKMRAPGMTLMKMPIFVWCALASMVLVVCAFPILTATLGLLSLDRLLDMHFFTPDFGGNPMMYVNLIWAWGHPEVYILILPAFGVFSEVVATFSQKRLFGYTSMVWAIISIAFLSFIVWLHHFFTMGAGPNVNAFFGIMTMIIAVPTGVKIFNWLMTMYRGKVQMTTPMLWFIGFVITFTTGGLTGVLMSIPAADFQVHNSLFLIAHFHSMVIGGVLFGFFSGFSFWFPKYTGFKLNERLGKYAFRCWLIGFLIAFMPLYVLGLMGATRRLDHYDASLGWQPIFILASIGAAIIMCGIGLQVLQILLSIIKRKDPEYRDVTGDPWNGRTLDWSTASPPPFYNFAHTPEVHTQDAFWDMKQNPQNYPVKTTYNDIHLPKNTPFGFLIGCFGLLCTFGIVWYMTWLGILGIVGVAVCLIIRLSNDDTDYYAQAKEIEQTELEISKRKKLS